MDGMSVDDRGVGRGTSRSIGSPNPLSNSIASLELRFVFKMVGSKLGRWDVPRFQHLQCGGCFYLLLCTFRRRNGIEYTDYG